MDSPDFLRFFSALLFVISLMGLLWFVLKKLGVNGGFQIQQGKKRRLQIVETLPIDMRHKAVILRRDDKEHLVILGPNGETVVESDFPAEGQPENVPEHA